MCPQVTEDSILCDRRSELARRLISHGVRTDIISKLTGLTRNRQATVRRRLMVPDKARHRGPARSPLSVFLVNSRARAEDAALAVLCSSFEIPIESKAPSMPKSISLEFGERNVPEFIAIAEAMAVDPVELFRQVLRERKRAMGDSRRSCAEFSAKLSWPLRAGVCIISAYVTT
jgi:hypothetical protein